EHIPEDGGVGDVETGADVLEGGQGGALLDDHDDAIGLGGDVGRLGDGENGGRVDQDQVGGGLDPGHGLAELGGAEEGGGSLGVGPGRQQLHREPGGEVPVDQAVFHAHVAAGQVDQAQ